MFDFVNLTQRSKLNVAIKTLENERELLRSIGARDQDAFRLIYNQFHESVYTFSLWYLKYEVEAEEVTQEIFLKLWQLGAEATNIENLDGFLKTLTRNRSLDVLRQRARETRADVALAVDWQESHNDTEEQILLNDTKKVLQEGIDLLPQQQKLVYQLCRQQGLKNDEVAEQLNLSPLTVRTHMKLALKFLRTYVVRNTDIAVAIIILNLF